MNLLSIGKLKLQNPFIAGPMAELSHIALRSLIASFGGAGLQYTEMLDATRLLKEIPENNPWLDRPPLSPPLFYQLVVSDSEIAGKAAQKLSEIGADGIDVNMACSAPSIKKKDKGVMLMKNPDKAKRIIETIRNNYQGPLTSKIRTGFNDNLEETVQFSKELEKAGIDAVIYHPRLSNQKFRSRADWKKITDLKEALNIPVIGNGDIQTASEAIEKISQFRPNGVMISRMSAQKPWIFSEIDCLIKGKVFPPLDKRKIWLDFFDLTARYFIPRDALKRVVRWTEYFSKNFTYGHTFYVAVSNAGTLDKARVEGEKFLIDHVK